MFSKCLKRRWEALTAVKSGRQRNVFVGTELQTCPNYSMTFDYKLRWLEKTYHKSYPLTTVIIDRYLRSRWVLLLFYKRVWTYMMLEIKWKMITTFKMLYKCVKTAHYSEFRWNIFLYKELGFNKLLFNLSCSNCNSLVLYLTGKNWKSGK